MDSVCAAPGPVYHERSRRNPLALPRHIGRASDCREMQRSATIKSVTDRGEVAERLKALASKASVRETVPWVRIPPSPPYFLHKKIGFLNEKAERFCSAFEF